jgi:hypothetical protein
VLEKNWWESVEEKDGQTAVVDEALRMEVDRQRGDADETESGGKQLKFDKNGPGAKPRILVKTRVSFR